MVLHQNSRAMCGLCVFAVLSVFNLKNVCSQEPTVKRNDRPTVSSIADLERIPVGIQVVISPDVIKAVTKLPVDRKRSEYTWVFRTDVTATEQDLVIHEFGAFNWDGTAWKLGETISGKPFGKKEFSEWYGCKDGLLKVKQTASDPISWQTGSQLVGSKTKWFFIGVDAAGKKFRGDAVIETVAEVGDRSPLEPLHRFAGSWKKDWKLLPSEWVPSEVKASGSHSSQWILSGQFLKEQGEDSDGGTYFSMYSYDETAKEYQLTIFQSRGMKMEMVGAWDPENVTMTWRNAKPSDLNVEMKYRLTSEDTYEFEFITRGADQKRYMHIQGTAKRDAK